METAKIFTNGGSQAVRLPKDCRFSGDEVLTRRIGSIVILMPKDDPWGPARQGLDLFTDDYLKDGIAKLPAEERPEL